RLARQVAQSRGSGRLLRNRSPPSDGDLGNLSRGIGKGQKAGAFLARPLLSHDQRVLRIGSCGTLAVDCLSLSSNTETTSLGDFTTSNLSSSPSRMNFSARIWSMSVRRGAQ